MKSNNLIFGTLDLPNETHKSCLYALLMLAWKDLLVNILEAGSSQVDPKGMWLEDSK